MSVAAERLYRANDEIRRTAEAIGRTYEGAINFCAERLMGPRASAIGLWGRRPDARRPTLIHPSTLATFEITGGGKELTPWGDASEPQYLDLQVNTEDVARRISELRDWEGPPDAVYKDARLAPPKA